MRVYFMFFLCSVCKHTGKTITATPRQLESLIRLSQVARLHFTRNTS